MKFVEDKNFVNFSRISPVKINTCLVNISSLRHEFVKDGRMVIGVSCGMVFQSLLECVPPALKYPFHRISLTLHCQDAERYEASLCSIANKRTLVGQIYKNAISFQTVVSAPGKSCLFCNLIFIINLLPWI